MDVANENNGGANDDAPLHLWFDAALLPEGWAENVRLSVAGGIVTGIERDVPAHPGDHKGQVGIPGLPNVHSHAFQRGMAGLAEVRGPAADNFWTWREIMYRFLDRITPEDMEAIATLAYVEMLESGFTRVGEFHYVHHDCDGRPYGNIGELTERICSAAQSTGINLTLLPSFYAHAGFGGQPPVKGQRRFITSLDKFARLVDCADHCASGLPGANVGIAPHSLRAVTAAELEHLAALCVDRTIHVHAAEQVREVEDCIAATGARPVEWLLDNVPLDERWCLIHATHMTPTETERLARSGVTVGLCPITEANLGDGVFPAAPFLVHDGHFGIGTDSNVSISAANELCMLEYSQRLANRSRNIISTGEGATSGRSLFDRALVGGNRALGNSLSGFEVDSPADIVTLDCDYASLSARERGDAILDRLIFGGRAGDVIKEVWVRGKRVVADGLHIGRKRAASNFRRTLKRILSV